MSAIRVEFCHGTWWLVRKRSNSRCLDGLEGSCDPPEKKGRKWIYVSKALKGRALLEAVVHEISHAADPRASEEAIEEQARVLADVLWEIGYRRT